MKERYWGTSLIRPPPPEDHAEALCLGTFGDSTGEGVAYERGNPVVTSTRSRDENVPLEAFARPWLDLLAFRYRGTSLIRNTPLLGPYSRTIGS